MGAQIAAHLANAGVPVAAARRDRATRRARAWRARARSSPIPSSRPRDAHADPHRQLRQTCRGLARLRLDHRSDRRAARRQAGAARTRRTRTRRRDAIVSLQHLGHSAVAASPRAGPTPSAGSGSARTSSIRRAICALLELIPTADTDPAIVRDDRRLRRSPPRQGRGAGEGHAGFIANRIGLFGVMQVFKAMAASGTARSRRSTRSPARPSAGRRARRSGRWTSPGSTSWRQWRGISASGSTRPSGAAFALPPVVEELVERGLDRERRAARASTRRPRPARSRRSTPR